MSAPYVGLWNSTDITVENKPCGHRSTAFSDELLVNTMEADRGKVLVRQNKKNLIPQLTSNDFYYCENNN